MVTMWLAATFLACTAYSNRLLFDSMCWGGAKVNKLKHQLDATRPRWKVFTWAYGMAIVSLEKLWHIYPMHTLEGVSFITWIRDKTEIQTWDDMSVNLSGRHKSAIMRALVIHFHKQVMSDKMSIIAPR